MDKEQLRQNYERLPDFKIIHMANFEANQLQPEALEVLLAEIEKRNLSGNLVNAVKASTKKHSEEEITEYINIIRNLPDPTTGKTNKKLNATIISKTISFIVITRKKKTLFIGNPDSINKELGSATTTTAALGWWGIPWGIFYSISSIIHNSKMGKIDYEDKPTNILAQFVVSNIGYIESNKHNPQKLKELIVSATR